MKSVPFEGCTLEIGKNQPQYNTIHAMAVRGEQGRVVMCFEMNEAEAQQFAETRRIYMSQLTFGGPFQPINLFTQTEFDALLPSWKAANADPEPSPLAVRMATSCWMHASTQHIPMDTALAAQFIKVLDNLLRTGYVKPQEEQPSGDANN